MPTLIALVGDSDISRWPSEHYPSLLTPSNNNSSHSTADDEEEIKPTDAESSTATATSAGGIIVSGHSGATLRDVIPHVQETLGSILLSTSNDDDRKSSGATSSAIHSRKDRQRLDKKKRLQQVPPITSASDNDSNDSNEANDDCTTIFLVICAGENDIGNGISLKDSTQSLDELLSTILHHPLLLKADNNHTSRGESNTNHHHHVQVGVIFLGPKLEPWLRYDADARKDYIRMSRSFEACFQRHCNDITSQRQATSSSTRGNYSFAFSYVDCLTMFCGDNADKIPGALLGGKAQAQDVYFDRDELHLSNEGYKIWKHVIENRIGDMMSSRFQYALSQQYTEMV